MARVLEYITPFPAAVAALEPIDPILVARRCAKFCVFERVKYVLFVSNSLYDVQNLAKPEGVVKASSAAFSEVRIAFCGWRLAGGCSR